ncbi:quinol monooxygenase YgiN [Prauserella shujinwangii]|uniref:Quinol monooxygenase YgiN n=1 Tax=Prauserella shujinwangii TaxID=1453103 RepID=A0A2T0LR80_9PSEU|nr:antibiotic biosynthesis monooxygenase family protein [Prauserella shujinwangii]PRX45988.1 quinol monooxygenase YgiN [Prauserella shujinwangii]
MQVIVAGAVHVAPENRDRFVAGHRQLVERARAYPGCLDLSISADPLEASRVNIFEHWESQEVLDAWRASAPSPSVRIDLEDGHMAKHEIARSGPPFD